MNKKIIIIMMFSIFLIPIVKAEINFTGSSPITLETGANADLRNDQGLEAFWNGTYWWIAVENTVYEIARYSNDLTTKEVDYTQVPDNGCGDPNAQTCGRGNSYLREDCQSGDPRCSINQGTTGDRIEAFSYDNVGGRGYPSLVYVDPSTLTQEHYQDNGTCVGGVTISQAQIDDNITTWFTSDDLSEPKYAVNEIATSNSCDGEGTLDLPSSYEYPDESALVVCGGVINFITKGMDSVPSYYVDNIYDLSSKGYMHSKIVSVPDNLNVSNVSAWCDRTQNPDVLYMAYGLNNTNQSVRIVSHAMTVDPYFEIDPIVMSYQLVNLSQYDSQINITNDTVGSFYITKGNYPESFWLFYHYHDRGSNTPYIKALQENYTCYTSDWLNTTCVGDQMEQQRTVSPTGCAEQYQYLPNRICEEQQAGFPTIRYTNTSESFVCDSGWVDVKRAGNVISCNFAEELPKNCTNIRSNATLQLGVEWIGLRGVPVIGGSRGNAKYHALICNPTSDCVDNDYLCETQWNLTITKNWDNYQAGETATAYFEISNTPQCFEDRVLFGDYGWNKVRLRGTFWYTCTRVCGLANVCVKRGIEEYSAVERSDCVPVNETRCVAGCDEGTGLCIENMTDYGTVGYPSPSGNPIEWILGAIEHTMPTYVLYAISIAITGGVMVHIAGSIKRWEIPLVVGIGMVLIFLAIGWLPTIMGVLLILIISLILARTISNVAKGG